MARESVVRAEAEAVGSRQVRVIRQSDRNKVHATIGYTLGDEQKSGAGERGGRPLGEAALGPFLCSKRLRTAAGFAIVACRTDG